MKHTVISAIAAVAAIIPAGTQAQIVMNELMQSNIDCIMDDLNEFPDSWVELYNAGTQAEQLSDYALGVKDKRSKAYQLPQRTVQPGEFVVVYCDKEEKGLHASFRLESGKDGAVYLFKGNDVVDRLEGMKKQPAPNIAYGRAEDGTGDWGYQDVPTPGAANCGRIVSKILPEPVFSTPGRVGSESFTLSITAPDDAPEGTKVRFTTDGTEPTAYSRECVNGLVVNKTTVVRARLFCDGWMSPRSTVQSYIFFPRDMTLPVVSMVCPAGYFYDNKIGIYVDGTYSSDPNTHNYNYDWRRPVNLEIFEEPGGEAVVNQLCETRVKGGASRGAALKSLVLYANKRFGVKRFEHEFFPEDAPGLTDWKSIELRNAGNDFDYLYFRDALIQHMMGSHADLDWQPWQPAIFMLNGEYKGMLNIRTRSNEDHIYTFYDGEEDIDMFENWWELKEGDWDNFNAFKEFYSGQGHTMEEYEQWMDTGEFANLMIMDLFYDNKDFPGNNIVMWRPKAEGGRWRWVAKDTDFGMGLYGAPYNYKTFNWIYNPDFDADHAWANGSDHTRLFRRLMDVEEFRTMFVDRCAVYMGDFLNGPSTIAQMQKMRDKIDYEYPHHRQLFNPWWPNYDMEFNNAKTWVTNRTKFFYDHLADYYQLGTPRPVTIDAGRTDDVRLTVNNVPLSGRSFDGKYFQGRVLRVQGEHESGITVKGWKVEVKTNGQTTTTNYGGGSLALTVPVGCQSVTITSVPDDSGIDDALVDAGQAVDPTQPVEVIDMTGRSHGTFRTLAAAEAALNAGIYILRQGVHSTKYAIGR
ncbi:MAG: CotH kinase family protein [Muribaculaceae bacterium]|nr:CotH kinase family protein [Muribaculaceae bacterium]